MSTMTEVIAAHTADWVDWETSMTDRIYYRCLCGQVEWHVNSSADYHKAHAEHVAAELAAAGYGNTAAAWDTGHHAPTSSGYLQDTPNPYRGAGHDPFLVREAQAKALEDAADALEPDPFDGTRASRATEAYRSALRNRAAAIRDGAE